MAKISFGKNKSETPTGSFLELASSEGIYDAEFVEFIGLDESVYLVSQITEDTNGYKKGDCYIKEALANIYADGSGTIYLNSGNRKMCQALEERINSMKMSTILRMGGKMSNFIKCSPTPIIYDLLTMNRDEILATEISETIFNEKKELISSSQHSFFDTLGQLKKAKEQVYGNRK